MPATLPGVPTSGGRPLDIVVAASGNLGLVYFLQLDGNASMEEIDATYPGLVTQVARHDGMGFVVGGDDHGLVAVGADGTHDLTTESRASTPSRCSAPRPRRTASARTARQVGPRHQLLHRPGADEVAAFEELVGCHGGLGGWQTRPLLVHPAEWTIDEDLLDERGRLRGADTVHHQMVRWLERLGHRTDLQPDAGTPVTGSAPTADPVR